MTNDLANDFDFYFILPAGSAATPWLRSHSRSTIFEVSMTEISKSWKLILYIPLLIISSFRVKAIITKEKIDIVHSNDLYNMVGPALKFFGAKFRYICHVRFLPGAFPPSLFRFWINRQLAVAEKIIAVSDVLRDKLPANPKIVRIHDRMLLSSSIQTTNTRKGNTILYLSNIIPGKGHDDAIEAFAVVHKKFPSWKLRFVGSDMNLEKNRRYRDSIKNKTVNLGIAAAIEWKEFADDVASEYSSAGIFANFSIAESFSMTCLEAQYYGCCVVATRSGGPSEIVDDGTTGFIVPVHDVQAMATALAKLMEDPALRESMGSRGASAVREKFALEKTSGALRSLYLQM